MTATTFRNPYNGSLLAAEIEVERIALADGVQEGT